MLQETFAERRYAFVPATGLLTLVSRSQPGATIDDCAEALGQVRDIVERRQIRALIEGANAPPATALRNIAADTICIHSDSVIAIELAARAAAVLRRNARKESVAAE